MAGVLGGPRSRGALSGVVLVFLGAWGALIPFIGPYFQFAYTPGTVWVYTRPPVVRGCSRGSDRGWWPDLAQQRQPRLRRVWCLASRAGGSVVRPRPDGKQAVGIVRLPTDRLSARRHPPADGRGNQLLRRVRCRHCVLCR